MLLIDPDTKTSLGSLQSYWMRTITDRALESAFVMSFPGDSCTQQNLRLTNMKELQSPDLILHEDFLLSLLKRLFTWARRKMKLSQRAVRNVGLNLESGTLRVLGICRNNLQECLNCLLAS